MNFSRRGFLAAILTSSVAALLPKQPKARFIGIDLAKGPDRAGAGIYRFGTVTGRWSCNAGWNESNAPKGRLEHLTILDEANFRRDPVDDQRAYAAIKARMDARMRSFPLAYGRGPLPVIQEMDLARVEERVLASLAKLS